MKIKVQKGWIAVMLGASLSVAEAVTNAPPWSDSFETYTNGTLLNSTNGWEGSQANAGTVTSSEDVVNLLTNYPVSGKSFPIAGSHTNVVAVNAAVINRIQSVTGGVVRLDLMALPTLTEQMPEGDTNRQFQVCVSTNGLLTIWHYNLTAGSNEWRELAASPVISTGEWSRFTVIQDYSNKMFQIAVNEGAPVTDGAGWTVGGAGSPGSWFYMVQTNGYMSLFRAEAAPAYLDDVVVARRSLSWSGTALTESVTNNGAIDNSSPPTITLSAGTFEGTVGENFVASGKVTVDGLPSNLVAVVRMDSETQLSVTLTGTATAHEAENSGSLTFQLGSTAFTLMNAWDVTGSETNVDLTFLDTPVIGYSTTHFSESITNNGSIDNTTPVLITLTHGTFAGAEGEDFAANAAKLAIGNPVAGLTVSAVMLSDTQLELKLLGAATANDVEDDLSNLTLTFQDGAFNTVPASSVFNAATNLSVSYIDPSTLGYGTTVFTETVTNNGTLSGTTLTLVNKSFNATNGEDLVAGGKVTVTNLPDGLGCGILRGETEQDAVLVFSGAANSHEAGDSLSNFGITFLDSAFVGANAAGIANATLSNLQIQFTDARTLSYSGTSFVEISGGAIDNRNPVTITLTGDTLTGVNGNDFVAGEKISVTNVPAGLTAVITRDSASQLSVTFTGLATAHSSGDTVSTIRFIFEDGAFTGGNAVFVGGRTNTGISITFVDDTHFFNVMPYAESFEDYEEGVLMTEVGGWSGSSADAGIVTNIPVLTSDLVAYRTSKHTYPIPSATHVQVLRVQDSLSSEIHSEDATNVFVNFMTVPVAMTEAPFSDTNHQWEFYVATNGSLILWQQTRGGGAPVNEWITLSNVTAISTSEWVRFTVENDYVNDMFRIWVNQGDPVSDSRAWTGAGGSLGGSWFYMVQTNGTMTTFEMSGGGGDGFLDDLTVNSAPEEGFYRVRGSIYRIR